MVLVDGDYFLFHPDHVGLMGEGGKIAARRLRLAILEELERLKLDWDKCRIIIRIYANITNLLPKMIQIGFQGEQVALSQFATCFTEAGADCEFIDSGKDARATYRSLSTVFDLFVRQIGCRHVFFAGCPSENYWPILEEYKGCDDLITLVKCTTINDDFHELGLRTTRLGTVFYDYDDPDATAMPSNTHKTKPTILNRSQLNEVICRFHPKVLISESLQ